MQGGSPAPPSQPRRSRARGRPRRRQRRPLHPGMPAPPNPRWSNPRRVRPRATPDQSNAGKRARPSFPSPLVVGTEPHEAEDATQEAFVRAYRALGRFREGAPFRPWLLRIVANEARNRRRSSGRRAGLAVRVAEDRPSIDAAPSPEAAVLAKEMRQSLRDAVRVLDEPDRLVLAYRYFFDLSEAEMADALAVP